MDNQLYSYDEVCEIIGGRNLSRFERIDDELNSVWHFGERGSSLYVKTITQRRFVLNATEADFNCIKRKADAANLAIIIKESKKDVIAQMISQYEAVGSKAILVIRNGNKTLNLESFEKHEPHQVLFFTNENLDFILDCLCENKAYVPVPKIGSFTVVKKAPEPQLTDEEIRDIYPEGCEVKHSKYGKGYIKEVAAGKITVLFEDTIEKIFAAKICIEKKLLTVID